MKIRKGFVSNSSSSSFIVIGNSGRMTIPDWGEKLIVDCNLGHCEFGWDVNDIYDIGSRIIFAYLQALDSGDKKDHRIEMLEEVIKDNTDVEEIEWKISSNWDDPNWGYIDHQSSACEGENVEMFDSYIDLKNFIFDDKSYIHTDNDNY